MWSSDNFLSLVLVRRLTGTLNLRAKLSCVIKIRGEAHAIKIITVFFIVRGGIFLLLPRPSALWRPQSLCNQYFLTVVFLHVNYYFNIIQAWHCEQGTYFLLRILRCQSKAKGNVKFQVLFTLRITSLYFAHCVWYLRFCIHNCVDKLYLTRIFGLMARVRRPDWRHNLRVEIIYQKAQWAQRHGRHRGTVGTEADIWLESFM